MTQSLTDHLQHSRVTVVAVDKAAGRVRIKGIAGACTDLSCPAETLVVCDEGTTADLDALNPGDIVRLEGVEAGAQRIVVVRRVWDEFSSPEW